MKRFTLKLRPGDWIIIILLLALSAGVTAMTIQLPTGQHAVVTVNGERAAILPVGEEAELEVEGPLGITTIVSDADGVRIVDSPCPHKLCVRMGRVLSRGQTILCVPNHVAIRVEGDADDGVDGVTG
ncbi:NusG domain II-containing protein [bacterium]|nr:NusG domain II-containing protein [bacterium]